MTETNANMITKIQADYREPDKLMCHLGWYRTEIAKQQQAEIERLNAIIHHRAEDGELRDMNEKLCEQIEHLKAEVEAVEKDNKILHNRLEDLAAKGMEDMGLEKQGD
jgi:hypothetical protein